MKKMMMLTILMITLTNSAFAVIHEGPFEKPLMGAWDMEIYRATEQFLNYNSARATLLQKYEDFNIPTDELIISVTLISAFNFADNFTVKLPITKTELSGCGDRHYAYYTDDFTRERIQIVLTDWSNALCEIMVKDTWQITINRGHGYCGTNDDFISIGGNPEPVYTAL